MTQYMKNSTGFMDWCLAGIALCWIGCPKFVGYCITSFWTDGCWYWNLDSTGILYVLHGQLYRRHQVSFRL